MTKLILSLTLLQPTLKQVLWRSGCPPHKAGKEIEERAAKAIDLLASLSSEAMYGAVLFTPEEHPAFLHDIWMDKLVSVSITSLGSKVDELLDGPAELDRFMLDSAASVAVESYMKSLQTAISIELNMIPTKRIAPGYGDFPLSTQENIVELFPASGITCNESFMLTPVKSMTGVTGWIPQNN
ncbi:MAG: hypothetical protein U9P42_03350 [Candidatus Fermentibacteria bacterium]|nr:hypothetical protein [Candidatus Fermentibacteria bacterium]